MTDSDVGDGRDSAGIYLLVASVVVGLQAVALFVLSGAELFSMDDQRPGLAISTAVFFAVAGVGLAVCALALWRRASWARGPVVLAQLITLGLAWNARSASPQAIAIVLLVVAVVALVALFAPATTAALTAEEHSDE